MASHHIDQPQTERQGTIQLYIWTLSRHTSGDDAHNAVIGNDP